MALMGVWIATGNRAEAQNATVTGTVRDALRRPLAGVAVRLETAERKTVARGLTEKDGRFAFPRVRSGVYSLIGEKSGFETGTAIVTVGAKAVAVELTLAATQALNLTVTAQTSGGGALRDRAAHRRYGLHPDATGDRESAGGGNIPLNQTLLQAPGVSRDSFGQIHLRNDHANIQYRINGVIRPEGISFFGQSLTSRFAS
jgi:Carboxypeptidase regulatory-like domain